MQAARRVAVVLIGLLVAGGVAAQDANPAAADAAASRSLADLPTPMESRPYRVRLLLASGAESFDDLRRDVMGALERSVGSLWDVEIAPLGIPRFDDESLRRWKREDVSTRFMEEGVDFWFAATIIRRGSQRQVTVRGWQPRFEWLSPTHAVSFYEPRETASRIVHLCWGLFRPEIVIEHVDQNDVRVRIPGGDLRAADPNYTLFEPGDCLTPWLLYYDRDKQLKRRQELPWTYVRLDTIQGALAKGTVLSGLRTPLAGKTRGRIDRVAVAARAVYSETRLQLGVQNQPSRRLAGYLLELRPKLPERRPEDAKGAPPSDESDPDVRRVLTDRLGNAVLAPLPDHDMTWIFVYSGDLLLARVPFVPGSVASLKLDVPDDSVRLQVAGELQVLEGQLINLVAERNTLIAAARAAAKKNDWKRVDQLRAEMDLLPGKNTFVDKLSAIRVPALNAAKARKDRNSQVRIERMCKDVAELIDRYLDADKIRLVKEELDELKKAVQEAPQ